MAAISKERPQPEIEIILSQATIESLANNTLTYDFFDTLKKAINEGFILVFEGHGGEDNFTRIQDTNHLKNYINNIQRYRDLK